MSARPQVVAGIKFKTKKALTEHVKCILQNAPIGSCLDSDDFHFMRELLKRHPGAVQKTGAGVACIRAVKHKPYNTKGFELERVDGTRTDFSYIQCLSPESQLTKFKKACRFAVSLDVVEYKTRFFRNSTTTCATTGVHVRRDNCDVDHAPPWTFEAILSEFMQVYNIDVDKVSLTGCNEDGAITVDLKHSGVKSLWVNFHRERAELQILHKDAHVIATRMRKGAAK